MTELPLLLRWMAMGFGIGAGFFALAAMTFSTFPAGPLY